MSSFNSGNSLGATEELKESSGDKLRIGYIEDGELLVRDGNYITGGTVIGGDQQVKASPTDDAAGFLTEKVVTNQSLTISVLNAGNDEQFQISAVFGSTSNTVTQGNDSRLPTLDQKAALAGTDGIPSSSNKFVTDSDPRLTDINTGNSYFPNGW